jgi:phosphoglycolate phosphatase
LTFNFKLSMYEHIVFDLDGTLVDSLSDLTAAVNHALRALGAVELPREVVAGYVGEGARVLVQRALGVRYHNRLEEGLQLFLAYYGAHLLDHTRPYPHIGEMLAGLVAWRVALSVLSNKPEGMSRAILDGLGLSSYFVAVLGGDSLPTRKPDPAGLDYLRALTATPRERMLVVGDSVIDVRTARAAGLAFCGVAWGMTPAALRGAAPQYIIDHPMDLLAIVERGG